VKALVENSSVAALRPSAVAPPKIEATRSVLLTLAALLLSLAASAGGQTVTPSDAIALEQQGRTAEAAQAWRAVTAQYPRDAGAFASLGLAFARQEKYAEAVPAYKKAIALNPKLPGIHLNLGLAEFKLGQFEAAIAPLRTASNADPRSLQARTLLGLSYYGARRFAEAARQLELVTKVGPADTELLQVLAQSCLGAKRYSCALEQYQQILQKDPNSSAAHTLAGEALDGLGRTPEAIAEFQTAINVAPKEPNLHFGLGYLYWKSRQYDNAASEFNNELAIDPGNAQALAYLGDIEFKRDHPAKALDLLRKAVGIRNDIRVAYLDIGAILAQQNQHKDALAALLRAEKLDPAQPDVHLRLGRLYQAMGNKLEAQKEFAKLRELHQKSEEDISSKMSGSSPGAKQ
jgi:tetratricopeptide (TPR) repeat protein